MFNWADWLIVLILVISSLISLKRGLVKEALSLAVWILALVMASWFSLQLAPRLTPWIGEPSLRYILAFAAIVIAVLIVGGILNYILSSLVKATGLSGTDRLLGMLFGLLRGLIIVMLLVIYVPKIVAVDQDNWWQQSRLIPHLQNFEDSFLTLARSIYDLVQENIQSNPPSKPVKH